MKTIGQVKVENMSGCKYAYANLGGKSLFSIGGKNHQGKTSFWKAIRAALEGKAALPPDPIHEGEFEAEVTVELNGETEGIPWPCTVTRTITRKDDGGYSTRVEIISDDGLKAPTPQSLLNELLGSGFAFDPLAWVRMRPKEQADMVRRILGIDFTELDNDRQRAYDQRTEIGRQIKQLDGQIKGLTKTDSVPSERVDVSELIAELDKLNEHNRTVSTNQDRMASIVADRDRKAAEIDRLERQLSELRDEHKKLLERIEIGEGWLAKNQLVSTDEIKQQIGSAEATNKRYDEVQECLALRDTKAQKKREEKALTNEIKKIDKQKRDLVSQTEFPVDGLGFGPDGIVKDGIAFEQLASSEQNEIGVALAIAANPDFPFVVIQDGSLLDEESRAEVEEIIQKLDGQGIIELVGHHDHCHIFFEEGVGKAVEVAS